MSLQQGELVAMETSFAIIQRQRPEEVSIPPSSPSDTGMILEAGGDPTQNSLARGDPQRDFTARGDPQHVLDVEKSKIKR